jgi:hypothetical protein
MAPGVLGVPLHPEVSHMQAGIVGLPNVGKSTLFNALTEAGIEASNYPFCTIEPNVGVVPCRIPTWRSCARSSKSQKIIPLHSVKIVDIAGLVKGASEGAGLGNKFLSPHPRGGRDHAGGALLRGRRCHARGRQRSTRCATSRPSRPS